MSQLGEVPSPPAPPPPPLPSVCLQESKLNTLNNGEVSKVDENQLNLAIQRLCSVDRKFSRVFYLTNTNLMPQLQDGPKCGLVALSIASSASENFVKVDDIFQTAVSLGFTKQGEMFSTNSLATLAEKCGFKTKIIKGGLHSHLNCIIKSLLRKQLLLIPYDADFNHSPCCKRGFKAHWTVITGFLILGQIKAEHNDVVALVNSKPGIICDCTDSKSNLPLTVSFHQGKVLVGRNSPEETSNDYGEGKLYLIGMQGKSRHVGLWPFDEMTDSNLNLSSFSKNRDSRCYVLPEGGLEEGLKGKAIILELA